MRALPVLLRYRSRAGIAAAPARIRYAREYYNDNVNVPHSGYDILADEEKEGSCTERITGEQIYIRRSARARECGRNRAVGRFSVGRFLKNLRYVTANVYISY